MSQLLLDLSQRMTVWQL